MTNLERFKEILINEIKSATAEDVMNASDCIQDKYSMFDCHRCPLNDNDYCLHQANKNCCQLLQEEYIPPNNVAVTLLWDNCEEETYFKINDNYYTTIREKPYIVNDRVKNKLANKHVTIKSIIPLEEIEES